MIKTNFYTKEENAIFEKYKDVVTDCYSIPLEYWRKLEELETIHKTYYDLFQNHYVDLKYYALMYRDIELEANPHLHDIAFFAQKAKDIIGYKERLLNETSLKSQVVQLYYNHEPMFRNFCTNVLDLEMWKRIEPCRYRYDSYIQIKNGDLIDRFCIEKLTDEQCQTIIENKNKITNYQASVGRRGICVDINKFVEEFYIPCFCSNDWAFIKEQILNYIHLKFPTEDINNLLNLSKQEILKALSIKKLDYWEHYYNYNGEDIKKLEAKIPKLTPYPQRPFYISIGIPITKREEETTEEWKKRIINNRLREIEHQRWREEEYHKQCHEIDKINNEKKEIAKQIYAEIELYKKKKSQELRNEYYNLIKTIKENLFSKTQVWTEIYNNKDEFNKILNSTYNTYFKEFWIKDRESCRAFHRVHRNYNLVELFLELEKRKERYINSKEYNDFCKKAFKLPNLSSWISSVKKKIEEIEKKERIEYARKAELERIEYEKRMEKFRFNIRNIHIRDKNIKLRQEDHVYVVNDIVLDSVTTFVSNAFPKFDKEYHAKQKAEKLGISPNEVLEMWERKGVESRDLGTEMHKKIEQYYLGQDSEEKDAYKLFKIFTKKIELKPYRTEWSVYDWEHKIAGTIDFVDYQNGEYIIYDWKRSDKIIDNGMPVKINKYGEKGLHPFEHLDNSPYYHYALQLSLYKYILEKNYGITISDLRLGIFHPAYNKPYVLRMPYLEKEIKDIFNLRSEIIF